MKILLKILGVVMIILGLVWGVIIFTGNLAEASGYFLATLLFCLGNLIIGVGLLLFKRLALQSAIVFGALVILTNFLTPFGWKQGKALLFSLLFYGALAIFSAISLQEQKKSTN